MHGEWASVGDMTPNRRNHYRVLHVQADAPAEVIKACYRTLMSTLRHHPDLGGDHETAAQINEAYRVLSNPVLRAAYDSARAARAKRSAGQSAPPPAAARGPVCPFCRAPVPARVLRSARCENCRAPLAPAPKPSASSARADRRGMPRVSKSDWALLHLDARGEGIDVRLRDLSLDGISLFSGLELPLGARIHVVGTVLDVVAEVVSCRRAGTIFTVHAHLLTAQFAQSGAFVSESA